jgi:uroporphyrinogen-III synthase
VTRRRLALTTSLDRASALLDTVRGLGLEPVVLPCIEQCGTPPEQLETARSLAGESDWVVVTSHRAVTALWPDGGVPDVQFAAVGAATAAAVELAGGIVRLLGSGGSDDLMSRLRASVGHGRVLYPHAAGADQSVLRVFEDSSAQLHALPVYRIQPIPPGGDTVDGVVFGSPSAVDGWHLNRDLRGLVVGVIGPTTRTAVRDRGADVDVMPPRPDFEDLIALTADHLGDRSLV